MALPSDSEDDVTALLTWAAKFGVPAALLCWVLYLGVNDLLAQVRSNTAMMQQHIEASGRIESSLGRSERRQERIESVLRQSCVNAARDYSQRQACWDAGER